MCRSAIILTVGQVLRACTSLFGGYGLLRGAHPTPNRTYSLDEHAPMKAIDFGLSDFIRPDERLNDIVGSAYYVAPEFLHRSYSMRADVWSVGVITYILLCGSRPFWARTESGIFRAVLRADPNFDDAPWLSVSPDAKDFVKGLLNKDLSNSCAGPYTSVASGATCNSIGYFDFQISQSVCSSFSIEMGSSEGSVKVADRK